jgi:DNA-binding NtrC family response regulator
MERAVILARGNQILPEDLPSTLTGGQNDYASLENALQQQLTLDDLERQYIARVLEQTGGNKYQAAHLLGIDRKTLYRKLAQAKTQDSVPASPGNAPS